MRKPHRSRYDRAERRRIAPNTDSIDLICKIIMPVA
jgi:hypothetical protein